MENPVPREYAHYAANFQRFVRAEPPLEGSETERKQPDDLPLFTGIIEVDPLEGSEAPPTHHLLYSITLVRRQGSDLAVHDRLNHQRCRS